MTTRNLEHAVAPGSVTVLVRPNWQGSVGRIIMENIVAAEEFGFQLTLHRNDAGIITARLALR